MPQMSDMDFKMAMMKLGIVRYKEQDNLLTMAKDCLPYAGVTGTVGGLMSRSPQGFLAGVLMGEIACTLANAAMREQLKELARDP